MADAKPPADNVNAPDDGPAAGTIGARWRRILAISIPLLLAVAIAAVVFALWGPTPVGLSAPSQSPDTAPSAPSSSSPPSTPATEGPAVPTDRPPVAIDEPAPITPGLTAEISSVEAVEGTARGPGEVAGPSLRVTVTIANSTAANAPLNATVVSAYFGADRAPAPELREPGGSPLPSVVGAGKTVIGVYIFTVPEDERRNVTIMVDYSIDVDPLVFQGDVRTLINR